MGNPRKIICPPPYQLAATEPCKNNPKVQLNSILSFNLVKVFSITKYNTKETKGKKKLKLNY